MASRLGCSHGPDRAGNVSGTGDVLPGTTCRRVLDAVLDAVLVVDAHGAIVFANLAVERVFGWPVAELVGRGVEDLIPAALRDRHRDLRVGYGDEPTDRPMGGGLDLVGQRRDRTVFPAEVSLAPSGTAEDRHVIAVVRDVTARRDQARAAAVRHDLERRLRASDERFRVAFDTAPVGMLMVSARPGHVGEVIEVNRALCDLMGRSEADLIGQCLHDVFLPERVEDGPRVADRLLAGEISVADSLERRVVHAAGHDIWVEINIVLVRDEAGDPDYFFVTHVVDVTARRAVRIEASRKAEQDRLIATVLQEALLPDVPRRVGSADVAARYLPAAGAAVGGDWLDAFTLPDDRLGITIGDVAGHGIGSASTMSRLRYALRTLANSGAGPAEVVARLNQAMNALELSSTDIEIATVVHAQYDARTNVLRHCSAGHLPLLRLDPRSGGLRLLPSAGGPPIGVVPDAMYLEYTETVEPASLIIGYTDGLVERREHGLDVALERMVGTLERRLAGMPRDSRQDVELIADAVLDAAPLGRREDDTAVIVLALPGREIRSHGVRSEQAGAPGGCALIRTPHPAHGWVKHEAMPGTRPGIA